MSCSVFLQANVAQASANVLFGLASVVGEIGVGATNPVLFAALRSFIAATALSSICVVKGGLRESFYVSSDDLLRVLAMAVCSFSAELFFILGIALGGSVPASLWQPSQPIWTMLIAGLLKLEPFTYRRVLGILLAFAGCTSMAAGKIAEGSHGSGGRPPLASSFCFLIHCLSTPIYIIISKPLVQTRRYLPRNLVCITIACTSVLFVLALALLVMVPQLLSLVCNNGHCVNGAWTLQSKTMCAVVYYALFATVLPYFLQLWANCYLPSSTISAYYALQPVAAVGVCLAVIAATPPPHLGLVGAHWSDIGAVGILAGLAIVVREGRAQSLVEDKEQKILDLNHIETEWGRLPSS